MVVVVFLQVTGKKETKKKWKDISTHLLNLIYTRTLLYSHNIHTLRHIHSTHYLAYEEHERYLTHFYTHSHPLSLTSYRKWCKNKQTTKTKQYKQTKPQQQKKTDDVFQVNDQYNYLSYGYSHCYIIVFWQDLK